MMFEIDSIDWHVDLGCGRLKRAEVGIDRHADPGVDIVMNLDDADVRLPFEDDTVRSVISNHFLEHVGAGFIPLVDEVHRVLVPGGVFLAITPLFPSRTAVEDPDHKRYFMQGTWETFGGTREGDHWHESFSTPYTKSRFEIWRTEFERADRTDPFQQGAGGVAELRAWLRKWSR
jgi:SAM-dependent methyltransferase